nr:hypothetical protein [Acutalibacter muris]
MENTNCRKHIAVLLAIVLLCALFTGCKSGGEESSATTMKAATKEGVKELPVVTVLVDLCQSDLTATAVSDLLNSTPGYGEEFMIATETLPDFWTSGQRREAALTQLKTEILAGKGPEVFLCENPIMENGNMGGAVFEFPRQARDSHLLLPLDQYIEESERLEWDRLAPQIMEAGKNDEGQQILPLTFGFDVMGFSKENFTLEAELPMTSDEMLESSDPMVRYTGRFRTGVRSVFGQINAAVFHTPVEQEFDRLTREVNAAEEGEIEDIVHEHYMKMQMMLAES